MRAITKKKRMLISQIYIIISYVDMNSVIIFHLKLEDFLLGEGAVKCLPSSAFVLFSMP